MSNNTYGNIAGVFLRSMVRPNNGFKSNRRYNERVHERGSGRWSIEAVERSG